MFIAIKDKKVFYINTKEAPEGLECIEVDSIPEPEGNGMVPILMYDGHLYYEYEETEETYD